MMSNTQKVKNIYQTKKVWLVGIKGTGMTALAQILQRFGSQVAGSDSAEVFFTDTVLANLGIKVKENFSADNISKNLDLVIYSTAYPANHIELKTARQLGIPTIALPVAHGLLMKGKTAVAVSGTHGKTTITALLGYLLQQADYDPTVVVGAPVPQFDGNALVGGSDYFIFEACEYQNKFQYYYPTGLIINNIEYDHPDAFATREDFFKVFLDFAKKVPTYGFLVVNVDDVKVQDLITQVNKDMVTYGTVPSANWRIERQGDYKGNLSQGLVIYQNNNIWAKGETRLFGKFNLINILAAVATAVKLGVPQDKILKAISTFQAPKRRFEYKGINNQGTIFIDDFAHHPTAIQVTLKTIRENYPDKKITAIFHPHTFSRTLALFDEFSRSFKDADEVVILDIYGSAREEQGTVSSEQLVTAINGISHNAKYLPDKQSAYDYLLSSKGANDVVISMGAGDVWKIVDVILGLSNESLK